MKRILALHFLNELRRRPDLRRKLKIFAVMGGLAFVLSSLLLVWAAVSVFKFTSKQVAAIDFQDKVHWAEAQVNELAASTCWNEAQDLLRFEPWLNKPVTENLSSLMAACSTQKSELAPIQQDSWEVI